MTITISCIPTVVHLARFYGIMYGTGRRRLSAVMKLPFKLDPYAKASYTEQLADAMREAIRTGRFRNGDRLPSWDEMATMLGVSRRIPRDAMKILASEGCIVSRPRIGTVVSRLAVQSSWKAPVLYVRYAVDAESYASNVRFNAFRRRLLDAGYPTMPLEIPRKKRGGFDFPLVDGIRRFRHSLVVNACAYHPEIHEWCANIGAPVLDARDEFGRKELEVALQDFVAHCRRKGVKRIIEVTFASPATIRLPPLFASKGIKVEGWMIPPLKDRPQLEAIRNAAERAFARKLAKGRDWLPDLFFFTDDYLTSGALLALTMADVRIPEDVKVVTLANEGNVPVWHGSLAMLCYRQSVGGERLAVAALERLGCKIPRTMMDLSAAVGYIPGDTFPA